MYRFRAKSGDWIWLRTTAFAFLNPYTDEIEYVVCPNPTAKTGSAGGSLAAATAASATSDPAASVASADYRHTPSSGLDYSTSAAAGGSASSSRTDMYSGHHGQSAQQVYGYDQRSQATGSSPVAATGYGSPGAASGSGMTRAASVGKNSGTPTPPQSAWAQPSLPSTPGQQQQAQVSDASSAAAAASAYHYSPGLASPGSTGASTASGGRPTSPGSSYRSAAAAMWHWGQGSNGQTPSTGLDLGQAAASAAHPHAHHHAAALAHHQPAVTSGQELVGDMLHMLGHHGGMAAAHHHHAAAAAASHHPPAAHHGFENLGMFTGQYQ